MDNQELRKMVKEMLDTEDKGFNNWELEFLDNMFKANRVHNYSG